MISRRSIEARLARDVHSPRAGTRGAGGLKRPPRPGYSRGHELHARDSTSAFAELFAGPAGAEVQRGPAPASTSASAAAPTTTSACASGRFRADGEVLVADRDPARFEGPPGRGPRRHRGGLPRRGAGGRRGAPHRASLRDRRADRCATSSGTPDRAPAARARAARCGTPASTSTSRPRSRTGRRGEVVAQATGRFFPMPRAPS